MPVGVVDLLEMVDVRQQQAGSRGVRSLRGKTGGKRQIESAAIGQPGQFIRQRRLACPIDLLLQPLDLGPAGVEALLKRRDRPLHCARA